MKSCFLLLLCAVLFCAHAALAQQMSAEKMESFANSLFDRGDYYRAITEYERVIFYHPDHPLVKTARFRIALSYFKGEKLDHSIGLFRALAKDYPNEEAGRRSLFMIGEAHYQKRDYLRAIEVYTTFIESYPADSQADAARLKTGWAYLREGYWRQAQEEFRKLPPDSPLSRQTEGLAAESGKYEEIPKKSPGLAGGLSAVLPGSGQLYVGRPGDAAAAFLLNGAFIWATAEAFHNDNKVTGGILLFFESGWYLGNIYNAVSSAHKYNRRSEQQFIKELQSRYDIGFSSDGRGGNMLTFSMRF